MNYRADTYHCLASPNRTIRTDLKLDLNLDTINKSEKTKIKNLYNTDPKMLEQILTDDKRLYFRVTLFDLLQRAYNRNF